MNTYVLAIVIIALVILLLAVCGRKVSFISRLFSFNISAKFNRSNAKKAENETKHSRVGILDRGKGTMMIGNKFSGLDIAIDSSGEDSLMKDNEFE